LAFPFIESIFLSKSIQHEYSTFYAQCEEDFRISFRLCRQKASGFWTERFYAL